MNDSKTPPPRRDLDLENGLIDAQVVRNVFTHTLRKLDELLPNSQKMPIRELVTELFEGAKYAILKHRKTPQEIFQTIAPELKMDNGPNQREAHEKRLQTMKNRQ